MLGFGRNVWNETELISSKIKHGVAVCFHNRNYRQATDVMYEQSKPVMGHQGGGGGSFPYGALVATTHV